MKNRYILIFLLSVISSGVFSLKAQDTESEYEAFVKQRMNEMLEFKNQRDKEFANFLKESWDLYTTVSGISKPMPGPDKPTIYKPPVPEIQKPEDKPEKTTPPVTDKPSVPSKPEPPIKPTETKPSRPQPAIDAGKSGNVDFFGGKYSITVPSTTVYLSSVEEKHIAEAWTTLAKSNYKPLLESCLQLKKELQLNDWGYIMLAKSAGRLLSKRQTDDEITFGQIFILLQSDYKVKMARVNGRLGLLVATDQTLYSTPYVDMGVDRYFIIANNTSERVQSINTYKKDFASATKRVDMNVGRQPLLLSKPVQKTITYPQRNFKIEASVNKNLIDFYNSFPQTDIPVYMNAKTDGVFDQTILAQFKPMIEGKTSLEAASILLDFIQQSFPYATDEEQFGYEKPFFVEECFYYPYNDCEDRAVLYGYLVHNLLNLDVVLLQYPGHIATAICFPENVKGDYVSYKNKVYTVCDPTYINAPVGECMPQYSGVKPSVYPYK